MRLTDRRHIGACCLDGVLSKARAEGSEPRLTNLVNLHLKGHNPDVETRVPLAEHWCDAGGEPARPQPAGVPSDHDAFEAALRAYLDAARGAWPKLAIGDVEFIRYVAARTPAGEAPSLAHAGDLLLACACAQGVPAAIAAFHATFGAVIARVLSSRRARDLGEDSTQAVYDRLLVASAGAAPKIAAYKGGAPLRSWVATVAARTLMAMRRAAGRRREQAEDTSFFAGLAKGADPELLYLKEHYKFELEEAVVNALARLTDRERTLLRLHLGEQLSIDQLGVMYRVNRATAARWLAAARESLVTSSRADLRARLRLSEAECDSVMALVQSQFHFSFARRLS